VSTPANVEHDVVVERTALIVMDVQTAIVAGAPSSMLRAVRVALDGAHAAGIPVVYIQVLLRPGRAGVSPRNKMLTRLHEMLTEGAPGLEILPSLAPLPDDFVLTKHRVSSFAGSGLDVLLRSLDITHLVLTGVSTSTAVLGTAMAAADLDFELTVLSDACFNGTDETGVAQHEQLLVELFPRMAGVMTAYQWVTQWGIPR
jgi:nicotinamidase-related amidase